MDGVVEIITGRERRRRWSVEEKLRIVAETQAVGAQVRAVAVRNGLCESLVYTWRRQAREGVLVLPATPMFMPVRTLESASSAAVLPVDPEQIIKPQASAARSANPQRSSVRTVSRRASATAVGPGSKVTTNRSSGPGSTPRARSGR